MKWDFFFDSKFSKIAFEIQEFLMEKWNAHFMLIFLGRLWRKFIKIFGILTVYNSVILMNQLPNILHNSELKNKIGKRKSLFMFSFCGINKFVSARGALHCQHIFRTCRDFPSSNASKFFYLNILETKQIHEIMKRNIAVTGRWQKQRYFLNVWFADFLLFGYLWVIWFEITTFGSFNFCWNVNRIMIVIWVMLRPPVKLQIRSI
jgi:hypothetical protein